MLLASLCVLLAAGLVAAAGSATPQPDGPASKMNPEPAARGCGWRSPAGVGVPHATPDLAEFAEFPWVVAVLAEATANQSERYLCGGSLVHPRAVLTAAHCVTGRNLANNYTIRAGEWDTQNTSEAFPHQDRHVETVITHDQYRTVDLSNDIALLILKEPVEVTDNVNIACLPLLNQVINSSECFVTGWGKDVFGRKGKYQVILQKTQLPMVRNSKCQELLRSTRLRQSFVLHESFVCAGGDPETDTCKGDGGSPLVCPIPGQNGRYHQAGIMAWRLGCEGIIPGVYANVARLRGWIDEQMQHQGLDLASYKY